MSGLTVLSPHRDDAVFSLFGFLKEVTGSGWQVTVINFFTVSAYAPHGGSEDPRIVSALRRREDRRSLARISPQIRMTDCGLADAPLRPGIPLSGVCDTKSYGSLQPSLVREIAARLRRIGAGELVLAPLGLGDHVDHRTVQRAAREALPGVRLGYYEDLPYAIWTSAEVVKEKVAQANGRSVPRLKRFGTRLHAAEKRSAAAAYNSQVTSGEAGAIARWGEGIWAPATTRWVRLLRHFP